MTNDNKIHFEKITSKHQDIIFRWLAEPHMQEFWDNSQEHKDDIVNFINGRITPSNYFEGIFTYWMGSFDDEPFCFILTAEVKLGDDHPHIWEKCISTTGRTYSIDFGIGNKSYLGRGLASPTLEAFTEYFQRCIDPTADTFFIDPNDNNPRAKHVYEKAGFEVVGEFNNEIKYWEFTGENAYLMVKKIPLKIDLVQAILADYSLIQNMARFYVYDMSRDCGFISDDWSCPPDGLFECYDFKSYFEDPTRKAYLVKVGQELAGFALLNKAGTCSDTQWTMGEFFILAKFQGQGIGNQVTDLLWKKYSGLWEVFVIPENKKHSLFGEKPSQIL